tara:strand:- start:326 stop:793 length:468 start_codon:yes stop_codon:yes gene_type:complete
MKFQIVAIESKRPLWARSAFEIYQKRFDRSIEVKWLGLRPAGSVKTLNKKSIIREEGKMLLERVNQDSIIISMDKKGSNWNTMRLKEKFSDWLLSSRNVSFLIGGPEGLSDRCLEKSDEIWSLSPLTFPHTIVPVIIIEQLYRAWSIEKNHPYHR